MPRDIEAEKEVMELKYKLKTELETLIHRNIMEELENGGAHREKPRKTRRGQ